MTGRNERREKGKEPDKEFTYDSFFQVNIRLVLSLVRCFLSAKGGLFPATSEWKANKVSVERGTRYGSPTAKKEDMERDEPYRVALTPYGRSLPPTAWIWEWMTYKEAKRLYDNNSCKIFQVFY